MDRLILPEKIWRQLTEHAVRDLPNECLGMLAGLPDGRVCAVYEIVNASTNPHRFLSDPASLCAAEKRRRSAGWHLLGFYHSHPNGRPIPSSIDTDPEVNFWLDGTTVSLILAVQTLDQSPTVAEALAPEKVELHGRQMQTPRQSSTPGDIPAVGSQAAGEVIAAGDSFGTGNALSVPASAGNAFAAGDCLTSILHGYRIEARAYRLFPHRWQQIALSLEPDFSDV
jgi:proteasome lid subunit RPN8/RPN11